MSAPPAEVTRAQIRAAIKTTLDAAVGSIAKTHDYFRNVKEPADIDACFVKSGLFHVWMVSGAPQSSFLTTTSSWIPGRGAMQEFGFTTWNLHGYYGANDAAASEKTWEGIVDSVIDQFRADKKLGGVVIDSGPLQLQEDLLRIFPNGENGVLCHYARCELVVRVKLEG
jgi:hypothetical protein